MEKIWIINLSGIVSIPRFNECKKILNINSSSLHVIDNYNNNLGLNVILFIYYVNIKLHNKLDPYNCDNKKYDLSYCFGIFWNKLSLVVYFFYT